MLKRFTTLQKTRIVNNIVRACKNPDMLNRQGYQFLYLASGFIAHYNLRGFIGHYSRWPMLKNAILENQRFNQWHNFGVNDNDHGYYMDKRAIYNAICAQLKQGE
jgi:hypothetical protein